MIVDQKINKRFVGVYLIDGNVDGTQLATTIKPNWFKILVTKWFLGWKWISIAQLIAIQSTNATKAKTAKLVEEKLNKLEE